MPHLRALPPWLRFYFPPQIPYGASWGKRVQKVDSLSTLGQSERLAYSTVRIISQSCTIALLLLEIRHPSSSNLHKRAKLKMILHRNLCILISKNFLRLYYTFLPLSKLSTHAHLDQPTFQVGISFQEAKHVRHVTFQF